MVDNSLYDELIYDRMIDNINIIKALSKKRYKDFTAIEKQQWIDNIKKGCYTYTDLNRVESLINDIANRCVTIGINVEIKPIKTWQKADIPTLVDIERIVYNINVIRNLNIVLDTTPLAPDNIKLNYTDANNIESIIDISAGLNEGILHKVQQNPGALLRGISSAMVAHGKTPIGNDSYIFTPTYIGDDNQIPVYYSSMAADESMAYWIEVS